MGSRTIRVCPVLAEKKSARYHGRLMRSLRHLLCCMAALLCFTGCLQVEKVITLHPDGSGTISETVVLSKASLEKLKTMLAGFGGDKAAAAKDFKLLDEAKLREAVGQMGEGVTFVSATPISSDAGEGFTATYAFTDINALKIDQNPSGSMPSPDAAKPANGESSKEPVTFKFHKGSPAELAITMPSPEFKPRKDQAAGAEDMVLKIMQQVFKDMKITLALRVVGTIQETNAEFHDDRQITLMEMDMNKILADPEKLNALAKADPRSLQEAKAVIRGIDGVKVEASPEVKVKFQ